MNEMWTRNLSEALGLHFNLKRRLALLRLFDGEKRTEQQLAQRPDVTAARVALLAVTLDRSAGLVALEMTAVRTTKANLASLADLAGFGRGRVRSLS